MRSASADSSAATRSGWSQGSCFMGSLRNALLVSFPFKGKAGLGLGFAWAGGKPIPTQPSPARGGLQHVSWLLRVHRDPLELRPPLFALHVFRHLHGEARMELRRVGEGAIVQMSFRVRAYK